MLLFGNERPLPRTYPITTPLGERYEAYRQYLLGKPALAKEFWKTREPRGLVETRMFAPLFARSDSGARATIPRQIGHHDCVTGVHLF